MWRELRVTLAIMVVVLIAGAPLIFADAPQEQGTTSYLALVFQLRPSATPTPPLFPFPTPPPTFAPAPTPTPTLPPPSYNNCQADPNPNASPNYPIKITNINKVAESVTLQNVSTGTIDLTGWQMCSITGNQHHPIGSTLAPGASQTFPGPVGNIWNNISPDPGALYNPNGQLVSNYNS